jgi:hypothetical protein
MKCGVNSNLGSDLRASKYKFCIETCFCSGKIKLRVFWVRRRFSILLLLSAWLLLSTNQANISVHLSRPFSSLSGISGMLAWTLTTPVLCKGGRYHCEQNLRETRPGRKTGGDSALSRTCSGSIHVFVLEQFTQCFFPRTQFPYLQNRNQFPSMASKEHREVCLLMMLRMLGTYKYFPRRAGIFPLAIRLQEVCSISLFICNLVSI